MPLIHLSLSHKTFANVFILLRGRKYTRTINVKKEGKMGMKESERDKVVSRRKKRE